MAKTFGMHTKIKCTFGGVEIGHIRSYEIQTERGIYAPVEERTWALPDSPPRATCTLVTIDSRVVDPPINLGCECTIELEDVTLYGHLCQSSTFCQVNSAVEHTCIIEGQTRPNEVIPVARPIGRYKIDQDIACKYPYPPVVIGPLWAMGTWTQEEKVAKYLGLADTRRRLIRSRKAKKLRKQRDRAIWWFHLTTSRPISWLELKYQAKKDRKRYEAAEKAAATQSMEAARAIMRPQWASDQEK